MIIKIKLVELLIVTISLLLSGICIGIYMEAGLENGLIYAVALFLVSAAVIYKNRDHKRKKR